MSSAPSSKLKKRIITWTSIFVVLVMAFFGLLKLGIHFSSEILFELVKRETNGYYQLSFEEIDIEVWDRAIRLKKVMLKPDSSKDFNLKGLNNLYDLELAGLNIDLESINSIYTERRLIIENVRIIDPQIHIIRKSNAPRESFSLQTGNLYKEISDYLKVLRIDFFTIENAGFEHSPSEFSLGNIDLFVGNLLIDSASRPNESFYSESLELEIHNQSFMLKDSIHLLSFDRFLLSTVDSILTFENLVLKPINEDYGTFNKLDEKIIYNITIPNLKLKGVDYFSAYRNNSLEMEEISLTDSHIFLEEQTHSKVSQPVKNDNSLLKQLNQIFDDVKIGKMRLINTSLDIKTNEDYNQNYQHVKSERADIVLYNISLDSSNYHFDYGKKYFDDVDLIIKDYSSYLPDSIHTLNFDLLRLSSFDSSLVFKNFNISNNGKGESSDMFLSVDLPLLSLKGLNYLDILIHQKLLITEMRLQNPKITFEKTPKQYEKMEFSPDSIYAMIDDYLKVVGIKKLILNQGVFSFNNQLRLGHTDLLVSNFNIHNNSNSWREVLGDIDLEMHHIRLFNQAIQMKVNHLKIDQMANRFILDELSIDYLDHNISAIGDLAKLTIAGIDLDSISRGKFLAFDSIKFNNPQITVNVFNQNKGDSANQISGDKFIEIVNGQVNGNMYDGASFGIQNVNTKLTLGANNHIHSGQATQLSFTSPQLSHILNINELDLSKSQDLTVKGIRLHSIKDSLLHKVELNGRIPAITLHQLNQNMFWQYHKLMSKSITIDSPDLNLNLNDIATALAPKNDLEMEFQKVILKKARLVLSDKGQSTFEKIETPELSLTLEAFQYPQKSVLSNNHLMYADNVILNVKDLHPIMTNGDAVIIRQLNFNKKEVLILIDTLSFDQANSATTALLPRLKIVGLDLYAYLNEQHLVLDSVQMMGSQVSFDQYAQKTSDKQPSIKTIPESIDIKYFSSTATEIELKDSLNSTNYAIHEGNIEVRKFYAKGEIVWNQFLNYAQFASVTGKNLSIPLDDGYQLNIDQYDLHHPQNTLTMDHINLISAFTATEYTSQLTYQNNWFDVSLDQLTLSGLDFKRALADRQYYTEKILLNGLNALVYKDKSVPFQSLIKELPQSILRKIDTWIYIDTLQVKGDITYQQKPAKKEEVGEISFNSLDASLFQVTTVDSMTNLPMRLVSKGMFADTAYFEASVIFDMQDPKDKFTFTGQIDRMQLGALNKMLRPVANINIKDGYAERITFDIAADNELATGEMYLRYDNLKIQILNPEANDLKGLNKGVKTFFANTFVVKDKNPSLIVLRSGKIFQPRDSSRAIFHYWGQALLSGAVSSIGIHKSEKAEKKYDKVNE